MSKRPSFKEFKEEALQDLAFKTEYEALDAEFALIREFIKARQKARISQSDLAKKLKLQQPAIARFEGGGYATTSIAKLSQVANVLGYSLKVSLRAKKK